MFVDVVVVVVVVDVDVVVVDVDVVVDVVVVDDVVVVVEAGADSTYLSIIKTLLESGELTHLKRRSPACQFTDIVKKYPHDGQVGAGHSPTRHLLLHNFPFFPSYNLQYFTIICMYTIVKTLYKILNPP